MFFSFLFFLNPSSLTIKTCLCFNFNSTAGEKMHWVWGQYGHFGWTEAVPLAKGIFFTKKKSKLAIVLQDSWDVSCCSEFWAVGREMYDGDQERDRSLSLLLLAVDWLVLSVKHKKRCPPLRIPSHSIEPRWVNLSALSAEVEGGVVLFHKTARRTDLKGKYRNSGRNWF